MWYMFADWWAELDKLWGEWSTSNEKAPDLHAMVLQFDFFAYRGVSIFLDVLVRQRQREQNNSEADLMDGSDIFAVGK